MENLVYIHLASAYEETGAIDSSASPEGKKVSQQTVNWKKFSRTVWIHMLSFAIASFGLGMAGQAMAALRQGSKGPDVAELQQQLRQLGYFNRRATGNFGPLTKVAVIRFQQDEGLTPNGVVEEDTQQALQNKTTSSASTDSFGTSSRPTLKRGAKGSEVSYLQQLLADAGIYDGETNGVFDSLTNSAVKQFQRSSGLGVDGVVGKRTWAALIDGGKQAGDRSFDSSPFTGDSGLGQAGAERIGTPVLRQGDRGATVSDLQERLRDLGYFNGRATGSFGPVTKAAVIRFQRDNGLRANGIVEDKTQVALQNPASPRNFNVSALQQRLKERGYYGGAINGNYNAQTKAAVRAAQRAYGVSESDILKAQF